MLNLHLQVNKTILEVKIIQYGDKDAEAVKIIHKLPYDAASPKEQWEEG